MNLIAELEKQAGLADERQFGIYRNAVLTEAKGKKLKPAELAELAEALAQLGFTHDRLAADVAAVRRYREAEQTIRDHADADQRLTAARVALEEHVAETSRLVDERQPAENALLAAVGECEEHARRVRAAEERRDQLGAEYSRLLETESPEARQRKCHLSWVRRSRPTKGDYQVINYADLLANPAAFDLRQREVIPLPDQSPEELEVMTAIAVALRAGQIRGQPAFLLDGPEPDIANSQVPTLAASVVKNRIEMTDWNQKPNIDPRDYFFVRLPGQTVDEFEKMVGDLAKAWNKHQKLAPRKVDFKELIWPGVLGRPPADGGTIVFDEIQPSGIVGRTWADAPANPSPLGV